MVFVCAQLSTAFSFLRHWLLRKGFLCFPWPIKSLAWKLTRILAFIPSKQNETTDTKSDGGYRLRTIVRFVSGDHFNAMKARKKYSVGYIYKHENIFNLVQYSTTKTAMITKMHNSHHHYYQYYHYYYYYYYFIIIIINIMIIITNFKVTGSFTNWCYIDLDFMMIAWNR